MEADLIVVDQRKPFELPKRKVCRVPFLKVCPDKTLSILPSTILISTQKCLV